MVNNILYIHPDSSNGGAGGVRNYTKEWLNNTYNPKNLYESSSFDLSQYSEVNIIYIDSDITAFIKNSIIIDFIKSNISCNFLIRLHSPILSNISRGNHYNGNIDHITDKLIQVLKYLSVISPRVTFLTASRLDVELMNVLGITNDFVPYEPSKVINGNPGTFSHRSEGSNANVLFVASYYSKSKGHLTYLNAIKDSYLTEFEWWIAGDAFSRSEYLLDVKNSPELFDVLDRPDVHLVTKGNMHKLYSKCKSVVIPAYLESFSLTAYEALSYNCDLYYFDTNSYNDWASISRDRNLSYCIPTENFNYATNGSKLLETLRTKTSSDLIPSNSEIINKFFASRYSSLLDTFEDSDPYYDRIYTL